MAKEKTELEENKPEQVNVKFPKELLKRLDIYRAENRAKFRNRSDLIQYILSKFLREARG